MVNKSMNSLLASVLPSLRRESKGSSIIASARLSFNCSSFPLLGAMVGQVSGQLPHTSSMLVNCSKLPETMKTFLLIKKKDRHFKSYEKRLVSVNKKCNMTILKLNLSTT